MLARRLSRDFITLRPGPAGSIGVPEVSSGIPSPPLSPPLAAYTATRSDKARSQPRSARRGGAAYTIAGECERLFCETLKAVFLGEGNLAYQDSLAMGVQYSNNIPGINTATTTISHGLPSPPTSERSTPEDIMIKSPRGLVSKWIEMYDYVGGARFRGFVAQTPDGSDNTLFVFFDQGVLGCDLKPGLMALLELCSHPAFDCSKLAVCIDRHSPPDELNSLMRDLGWVGFEPMTLNDWTRDDEIVSTEWLILSMET